MSSSDSNRYYIGEQIGDTVPTYDEMTELLSNRVPFRGNSVSARYDGTEYQVMSYNTIIASINWPERWWINPNTYSKTTSRIQNIVREIDRVERNDILDKILPRKR